MIHSYNNSHLTKEEAHQFLASISPPRDLTCPITLTIFHNPVIALGDGHTYEKHAIETWLRSQRRNNNGGRSVRSPVTNSYMEGHNATTLVANKTVADMARHYRENLGRELCGYVEAIVGSDPLQDDGFRIRNLVEMGADLSVKGKNGNTPLMMLIQKEQMGLVQFLLSHNSPVIILNDNGMNCADLIQEKTQDGRSSIVWTDLLKEIKEKTIIQLRRKRQQEENREASNLQHRERQRSLANEARYVASMNRNGTVINGRLIQNGLGSLEEGYGYFPALVALQFQGSIPPPSASFEQAEKVERERLNRILKWLCSIAFVLWIFG